MSWNLPGESRFGIHSVDHFALEVPSLEEAHRFFTAFGLRVDEEGGHLCLRTDASDHVWGRLYPGPCKRLAYLSVSTYPNEYKALVEQALAAGATPAPAGGYVSGEGRWIHDDSGNLLQVKSGPKVTPTSPSGQATTPQRAGSRGVGGRSGVAQVRPLRLSHLLMFTPDIERSIAFYRDALGLRLADRSREAVAFMHGRHGSDHHLVAFAGSSAKGWHHSSWDVAGVDDVGRGGEQMRDAGYAEGWGTGRHVLGSNYFHYVRDPWGSLAEYSAGIDYVPAGHAWPAGDHPVEDSLYLWGPQLPAWFVENTEA